MSSRLSWHSLAFFLAVALLGLLAWEGDRTQTSLVAANDDVQGGYELIGTLNGLLVSLQNIETGQRGFVLTGQDSYLEPYELGLVNLATRRQQLEQRLAARGPLPAQWLAELDATIDHRLQIAAGNIEARRTRGLQAAVDRLKVSGGKQAMDHLRSLLGEAEEAERERLATYKRRLAQQVERSRHLVLAGGLLVAALLIAAFWAIRRNLLARQALAQAAQAGEARLDALLQAVPDTLYDIKHGQGVRRLTQARDARHNAPPSIKPALLALATEAQEQALTRHWQDADGNSFEVRVVPTGLGDHLAIARDVSEAQRSQRQLDDQRIFLRSVVDADENLIFVRDPLGRFLLCNLAFADMLGLRPHDVEGRQPGNIEQGDRLRPLLEGDYDLLDRGGELRLSEVLVTDAHGQERWYQLIKRPMDLSDGSRQVVAVAVDITVRRQMERMKAEFISTVSHELRTPLTAIRGGLGMLVNGMVGEVSPAMRPLLDIAHKNSERLVRLINDILDIEKLEAGHLALNATRQRALPMIEQALGTLEPYAQEYGVRLALAQPADDGLLNVDADRFAQVLANLLSNAIKHSPAGGQVTVSCERHSDTLEIAVTDRGQGIPEAFKSRIFERFAQADSSDVRSRGGTGLGLAITRSLVEQMHGSIGFESEQGQGTRFFLRFPLAAEPVAMPIKAASDTPAPLRRHAPRILVLEPDDESARQLASILQGQGYDTETVSSAVEARQRLQTSDFQALTLSPNVADEVGVSLLQSVREQPALRHLPVLVVSLQPDPASGAASARGGAVGVMDWLREPIDASRVLTVMRACLGRDGQRPNVLHIEDDPDLRVLLANLLADQEVNLHEAGSLAEAREQLTRRHHDLAILDLMLPDGDGTDLLTDLAQATPPTPVIIFSALDSPSMDSHLILRRLVKSRQEGSELAQLIQHYLLHWPGPLADDDKETP